MDRERETLDVGAWNFGAARRRFNALYLHPSRVLVEISIVRCVTFY
jgi:hypothetical protein